MPEGEPESWKTASPLCVLTEDQQGPHSAGLTPRFTPYPVFRGRRGSAVAMMVVYWDAIRTQPGSNLRVGHT